MKTIEINKEYSHKHDGKIRVISKNKRQVTYLDENKMLHTQCMNYFKVFTDMDNTLEIMRDTECYIYHITNKEASDEFFISMEDVKAYAKENGYDYISMTYGDTSKQNQFSKKTSYDVR